MANFKDQNTQEAIDLFLGNIEDILEDNEQVSLSFQFFPLFDVEFVKLQKTLIWIKQFNTK